MSTGESRKYHFFVMLVAKRFRRVHAALRNIQSETPLPPFLSGGYDKGRVRGNPPRPFGPPLQGGDVSLPRLWREKVRPTRALPRTTPNVAADSAGDGPP